jgi:hypothetical protein
VRRLLLALVLAAGALAAPGLAAPASAGVVAGACQTSKGVTVVVNFGSLGWGTKVSCYTGATSSTTGLSALHGAGFSTTPTQHDGDGFVCRISGQPTPDQDSCINTPPASAYWSYWQATNGGSWAYSNEGAATQHVHVGGFEGWSFGNGSARPTSSSPSRPPEPTLRLGPAASTTTHRSSSSTPSTTRTTATTRSRTPTPAATTTAHTTATPLATDSTTDSAAAALPADAPDPGRSPWPFVLGALGIAAVMGGAYLVVLRRRGGP